MIRSTSGANDGVDDWNDVGLDDGPFVVDTVGLPVGPPVANNNNIVIIMIIVIILIQMKENIT